jgi:hypothetical protein
MAHVVIAGLFEPETSVTLYGVTSAADLTPEHGIVAGRRLADGCGDVGFDGLALGGRYMARGFDIFGKPLVVRCRAIGATERLDIGQSPIIPTPQNVGTQERPPVEPAPAEPGVILQTGIPASIN